MRFWLLGGLRVTDGDRIVELGAPKQRAVLAALLLHDGRHVSPDRLADMVWGDDAPGRPDASLQAYIANLRRALEPGRPARTPSTLLVTGHAGYALAADPTDVDVRRAEADIQAAHQALAGGDTVRAVSLLDAALALLSLTLLPELAHEPWVRDAAVRVAALEVAALESRFDAGLALGEHALLLGRIDAAIASHPFHERLRAQLATALYRSGRPRDALAAINEARRFLADEAGLDAGPDLAALEQAILDHDPRLSPRGMTRPSAPVEPHRDPDTPRQADRPGSGRPFVGRAAEIGALRRAFADTVDGRGRAVVVSGEAGAGKTRLVEEFVNTLDGASVSWARCPEEAANAPYWPLLEIASQLEGNGLLEPLPDDVRPQATDDDEGAAARRLALHRTTVELLRRVSRPVVVVLDDLHWADAGTLRLVEYVAGELHTTAVMLAVTTRPPAPDSPAPLHDCLAELARAPGATRVELAGLDAGDVADWLTARAGAVVPADVARIVHDRTAGNAFFVNEVVELLATEEPIDATAAQRAGALPPAVQDVVRRRVARLPPITQQALATACVLGRSFDADVLAAVTGSDVLEILDALDPAVAARLAEEDGDTPGRYGFSHALVAETLVAEISASRRARIHAAAARALVALRAADPDRHAAEIARHAYFGIAAGTAEEAAAWSTRAALAAERQLADDDAAEHWARAVHALEIARPADRRARFDALIAGGRDLLRADRIQDAYVVLIKAIDLAIELDDPELVGQAAAATNAQGLWFAGEVGLLSVDAIGALERALAHMSPAPSRERAMAMGSLVDNAYWFWSVERIRAFTDDAVAAARATDDPVTLARVLHKRQQALWRPSCMATRRADSEEMSAIAATGALPLELEVHALFDSAAVMWEAGEVPAAIDLVRRTRVGAAQLGSPALITQLDFFSSALEMWRGDLDAAERSLEAAYDLYRRTRKWAGETFRAGFLMVIRAERGDLDGIDELSPAILDSEYAPFFGEVLAFVHILAGDPEGAARLANQALPPDLDVWPALGVNAAALHVRAAAGDIHGVRVLRDRILPYRGRLATIGTGPSIGDVDLALAVAARAEGDLGAARTHADASLETLRRNLAGPWLTRANAFRAELGDP